MRRNLVLVHDPGYQSLEDIETLRREVRALDETIEVHVALNTIGNEGLNRAILAAPTLVVSFTRLKQYRPSRGRVFAGRLVDKMEQINRLRARGIPAPRTQIITPGFQPDPARWGEVVLVKAAIPKSTFGKDVTLQRTETVRFRHPLDYPENHIGRQSPMMVQRFIDTGPLPSQHRVLTLFGVPLYARKLVRDGGEVSTDVDDAALARMPVAAAADPRCHSERCDERDVLELASAASRALPDVPLQGMDILRHHRTGKLFVIELNPGGNTWHFSSVLGEPIKKGLGKALGAGEAEAEAVGKAEMVNQFGAFRRAARALAHRTQKDAV